MCGEYRAILVRVSRLLLPLEAVVFPEHEQDRISCGLQRLRVDDEFEAKWQRILLKYRHPLGSLLLFDWLFILRCTAEYAIFF